MTETKITFVTAFIDLNEDRTKCRTLDTCISLFKTLVESGISICLYLSPNLENIGIKLQELYKNVKFIKTINLEDMITYKLIKSLNPLLPNKRCTVKDSLNYIALMNAKAEFVNGSININPFNTSHFAWIDFGICHIISNPKTTLSRLYRIAEHSKLQENILAFPGSWTKTISISNYKNINNIPFWRMCGGFYFGDKQSLQNMYEINLEALSKFINQYGIISWEVNIWAWMELNMNWKISIFTADHNDTILQIPESYIIRESNNKISSNISSNISANVTSNVTSNVLSTIVSTIVSKYIDKIIYINLEHRTDRKLEIEDEFNRFDLEYERYNAIANPGFGILGCGLSHLTVLKMARDNKWKNILIFEDDFMFLVDKEEFEKNIKLLFDIENPVNFDVCMLSYNIISSEPSEKYPFLNKVLEVQTASGYIVNEKMYDKLIELYEWAMPLLESTKKHWIYANDQIWKQLQPSANWYSFTTRIGKQRPSYSDNGESWCELNC